MVRVHKKRGPGRPSGTQYRETIPVRLTAEAAAAVDAWAKRQNERGISRSEAIRRLVDQALAGGRKLDAGTARDVGDAIVASERAVMALRRLMRR
jgi:metal-responsive CopG/Arc/MetJ family transcriptional regulator